MYEVDLNTLVQKTQKLKLLYVEDSKETREVVFEFLELFFDNISIAVDGEDAFSKYKSGRFDVILTDINMPNLNGLQLSQKIRELDSEIAIIVLSAYDKTEYLLDSIKYGVDAYLIKPFEMESFLTGISKVVQKTENKKLLEAYNSKLQTMLKEKTKSHQHIEVNDLYTDLPNPIILQEDLLSGEFNYMLLLDMSHFELLKEGRGREFTNHVITRTAHILKKLINKNAKLYKVESYKFVILLKNTELMNIHFYCEQIGMFFDNKSIIVDDFELHISFNIGIDEIRKDISQTLINCECALEIAKNSQTKNYEIYNVHTSVCRNRQEATDELQLTRELILAKQIKPYFQPITNLINGKVEMYEAFARGFVRERVVLPVEFIKSAQKLGLSTEVTKAMIKQSFKFFKDKTEDFSINLTELDLFDNYLIDFLKKKLQKYEINASRITFEIDEEIILDKRTKKIDKKIDKLRLMGFKIAVDNFSVKHSNLSRLFEVELDFIKIEGAFVKNLKDEHNKTITKAVVSLAKELGIKTIAKFVEDEETKELVQECEIDYIQGYLIGKPEQELATI